MNDFDRMSEKRKDENWIAVSLKSSAALFIPISDSKLFFQKDEQSNPFFLSSKDIENYKIDISEFIFLGCKNDTPYFLIEINGTIKSELENKYNLIELRNALPLLTVTDKTILLQARAMNYWYTTNKFCGICGSINLSKEAGNLLVCSNSSCGQSHFPRTDPAIIVLVTKDDKCLLATNKSWPGNRYSTLAGFVEPGETLEEAVKREVFEETGIIVENIKYVSSQPWPFPSSLMLGFTADAVNNEIVIDDYEIEHAAWFSREEILKSINNKTIKMPNRISIAFNLIRTWFNEDKNMGDLSDIKE